MKKASSLLIVLSVIMLFSTLILFSFEIKSLHSENIKNEYLYTQAKLHEQFLMQVVEQIAHDSSIDTLEFNEGLFTLSIQRSSNQFELYVEANEYPIRLHTTIIK